MPVDALSLAPAGVLRAAAWPLQCLAEFGASELGELANTASGRRGVASTFDAAYDAAIARERASLWARFTDDSLFAKALALSSPSAHARIRSANDRRDGPRNRAMRLAEYTLYRYLARAAGRATPHGLWAGVGEIRFGAQHRVHSMPPHCHFAPDLRPFQTIIRTLSRRPEYRYRAHWSLNPTLHDAADGGWIFLGRRVDGRVERRALEADRQLAVVLAVLAQTPPMALDRLAVEVARRACWPLGGHRQLLRLLDALAEGGVLVGGMDLPKTFESAWEALRAVEERLKGKAGEAWKKANHELHDLCAGLSAAVWSQSTDEFIAQLQAARDCLTGLADSLDLPQDSVPAQVLRCDLRLPWRLTLDQGQHDRLLMTLTDYQDQWLRGASPEAGQREQFRSNLAQQLTGGRSLGECAGLLGRTTGLSPSVWPDWKEAETPGVRERLKRWQSCLDSPADDVTLSTAAMDASTPSAPAGCFYAGLSRDFALNAHSISDIPTQASARFGNLLDTRELNEWVGRRLSQSVSKTGIGLAELRAACEPNPNALASPAVLADAVDPWGATPDSLSLLGASLQIHQATGRLVLQCANGEHPWAVVSNGAANVQGQDPLARLLLLTGFHEAPGRNQRAMDVPMAAELTQRRFSPRVRLQHGAVLRQRRSFLSTDLARLISARGAHRFRIWQGYARELGWPEQLLVSTAGGEAIRIHRDSPLAVESVFKGLRPDTPYLTVVDAGTEQGFPLTGGNHVAELALPFARD